MPGNHVCDLCGLECVEEPVFRYVASKQTIMRVCKGCIEKPNIITYAPDEIIFEGDIRLDDLPSH
jgi:hypothetical protein